MSKRFLAILIALLMALAAAIYAATGANAASVPGSKNVCQINTPYGTATGAVVALHNGRAVMEQTKIPHVPKQIRYATAYTYSESGKKLQALGTVRNPVTRMYGFQVNTSLKPAYLVVRFEWRNIPWSKFFYTSTMSCTVWDRLR